MRKTLITTISMIFLLMPAMVYAQSEQPASNAPPPVSQQLVAEGDFALKLVTALNWGTPNNEAQAEDILTSVGIAPKNGWIADYPMTPIIIGELENGVAAASDARQLPMGKEDALKAFQDLTTEFGLAVVPGSSGQYAENQGQPNPTIINNYYYEEGPPVVTYYPPPWDYYYLYSWVPYPFWCTGFFFPGFFVLNDFHTIVAVGHHHHRITNHFFDRKMNSFVRVDPTARTMGKPANTSLRHTEGFRSPAARKAATSIFNRSFERAATTRGPEGTRSRGTPGNTMNQMGNTGRQNEMNFRQGHSGSFNSPNVTHERSFNAPSTGGRNFGSSENFGRSFSPPSRSFSAPRGSFGGSHGGGFSGGYSSGGFSGGHGIGGFSGGHGDGGCRGRC
jgi:hypothetical protein